MSTSFQDAYLKPRRRERRRTIGKRRDKNAVGTLDETADGISGTFTHQVNQTEGKQGISISQVHKQYKMCTLTPAHTEYTLAIPLLHSLSLNLLYYHK